MNVTYGNRILSGSVEVTEVQQQEAFVLFLVFVLRNSGALINGLPRGGVT